MVIADEVATYAGAAAALLVAGVGGLLKLGNIAIKKQIDALRLELTQTSHVEIDDAVNQFGETVSAIRQKITEVELWNRDNFVNSKTFDSIVTDMRDAWRRLEDKIDRRFDMVDRKLSKIDNGSEP